MISFSKYFITVSSPIITFCANNSAIVSVLLLISATCLLLLLYPEAYELGVVQFPPKVLSELRLTVSKSATIQYVEREAESSGIPEGASMLIYLAEFICDMCKLCSRYPVIY